MGGIRRGSWGRKRAKITVNWANKIIKAGIILFRVSFNFLGHSCRRDSGWWKIMLMMMMVMVMLLLLLLC